MGVTYAEQVGFDVIVQRGAAAAEGLPAEIVYAGFSLGVLPAQMLTQTRPGARGAVSQAATAPRCRIDSRTPRSPLSRIPFCSSATARPFHSS
jgi:hypothetical protein